MSEPFLYPKELTRGPDLLRPGSSTGVYGSGQWAFIVTKYRNGKGQRFHKAPAGTGHERMICDHDVVEGLFGPDLDAIMPQIASSNEEYEYKDGSYQPSGRMRHDWDHWQIRERSMGSSLYGRYGTVRGRPVVMLWQAVPDWKVMLTIAQDHLKFNDEAVLCVGTEEVGTVGESAGVKDDPQEQARIKLMTQYHTATGPAKEALKKALGLDNYAARPYPDTSKMSQDQIAQFPWTRDHWRQKARQVGVPGVFDYNETSCGHRDERLAKHDYGEGFTGFKKWMSGQYF